MSRRPLSHSLLAACLAVLAVRMPPWVERKDIRINGAGAEATWENGYLHFANVPGGRAGHEVMPLPAAGCWST